LSGDTSMSCPRSSGHPYVLRAGVLHKTSLPGDDAAKTAKSWSKRAHKDLCF